MYEEEIAKLFSDKIKEDQDLSVGVVAVQTLMEIIYKYESKTLQELDENLKRAIAVMKQSNYPVAAINSGCELFMRFITFASRLDTNDFKECKHVMLERGKVFLQTIQQSRNKIMKLATKFISDGAKVLTHSRSRVVLQTLREAAKQDKQFEVYITVSAPDDSGKKMYEELKASGITCTLILDSAVGYVMEQVDFVMVGAEAVMESGGIVNKIGTYTMAICARKMNKPFYVLTESFKFSRVFPLNQRDLPAEYKFSADSLKQGDTKNLHPLVDYTFPSLLTLLFTDLGILTPSAVSDELIKLYL